MSSFNLPDFHYLQSARPVSPITVNAVWCKNYLQSVAASAVSLAWFRWGWLFNFHENLNNPLAVSICPDWLPQSLPGSGCLSNDKRFKSTNPEAGSSLLITAGDSLAQPALNLSWLIYSSAHPGHIFNAGPAREHGEASHSWLSRLKELRQDRGGCHWDLDLPCWVSSDQNGVKGDVILGRPQGETAVIIS